jgi:hypothetical protein
MTTEKKKAVKKAAKKAKLVKQKGDRAVRQETHRQDTKTEEAIAAANLPKMVGPDKRSSEAEQYLHPEDMLRLLLAQSEYLRAKNATESAKDKLKTAELEYLKKRAEIGAEHNTANVSLAAARGKLERTRIAVQTTYKIQLNKITFDDETGLIRKQEV